MTSVPLLLKDEAEFVPGRIDEQIQSPRAPAGIRRTKIEQLLARTVRCLLGLITL
jgi:hypothetical protein